jgi:hypothetical protein
MADRVAPGPVENSACIKESVCIHTRKIFDSCRDKDCVEDLRVYPTCSSQAYIDSAFSVRPRSAELLHVHVNVEEITFNRGYYTVDATYFYKITGETFPAGNRITGLAIFDKRVMLFGSEGSVKTFSSERGGMMPKPDKPIGVVESVDPIALHMKLVDGDAAAAGETEERTIPDEITCVFDEDLVFTNPCRRLYVTIGQFSIIRLERDTQLLIPAYDYCMPEKECEGSSEDDPCTMFSRIRFPVEEFFPPNGVCQDENYKDLV